MKYTLTIYNGKYVILCQTADMPTCMTLLGVLTQGTWTDAEMVNAQTGEVIVAWRNNAEYGVTVF